MPAIQPTRLRQQVAQLVDNYSTSEKFIASLHELLAFYADRTLRSSQVVEAAPLLHSYRVAKPVMRFIERELAPFLDANLDEAIILADDLWKQRWLETRLLAISILGKIPTDPPDPISDRARSWGSSCKEEKVLKTLASEGIRRLRIEQFDQYLQLLEDWYSADQLPQTLLGLRSTPSLLNSKEFDNLPLVFRWIAPLLRESDQEYKDDLTEVLRCLARSSPRETAFFIRQALASSNSDQTAKVIRRVVGEFPDDIQASLREDIREFRSELKNGR